VPRFSDEILEQFLIDPRRPCAWSKCPFCAGGTLLKGYRRDGAVAIAVAHTYDVMTGGGVELPPCEKWTEVGSVRPNEFLQLVHSAGGRFVRLTG